VGRKRTILKEQFSSEGAIFDGNDEIAYATFDVFIRQTVHELPKEIVRGLERIDGRFAVISGERDLTGRTVTVNFENGRKETFLVTECNPIAGTGAVTGTS
jgi:hypothetical protein